MYNQKNNEYNVFMRQYSTKNKDDVTHTRIGNMNGNPKIFPGKYCIPENKLDEFHRLYYTHVFENKQSEYLTEIQIKDPGKNGPVLIDLDFRYPTSVKTRQHNFDHIYDIVELYMKHIKSLFVIEQALNIPVYVFEKPDVFATDNVTKDGIHIIFGLSIPHICQTILREKVVQDVDTILDTLPLENDKHSVFDDGLTKGSTPWQLFGSKKPGNMAYELTHHLEYTIVPDVDQMDCNEHAQTMSFELFQSVSAHNTSYTRLEIKEEYKEKCKEKCETRIKNMSDEKMNHLMKINIKCATLEDMVLSIQSIEDLKHKTEEWLASLDKMCYDLRETYQYVMSLPSEYYNDRNKWIRVGWALHSCVDKMFLVWMLFSSKSDKFSVVDMMGYLEEWNNFSNKGLTHRSIMYWLKQDNPDTYDKIRKDTVEYMIEQTLPCTKEEKNQPPAEWDIAFVLYHQFKDRFRCASLRNKTWYYFKHHRWVENENGNKLRFEISNTLSLLYTEKAEIYMNRSIELINANAELSGKLKEKAGYLSSVALKLKSTQFKQNIMKEATEIFYEMDSRFLNKLDKNPYLLCFTNGVYDFNEDEFRSGRPEDYVSLSTNIKYIPKKNSHKQKQLRSEIEDFMYKLFPIDELRAYMWEHLASILIGVNKPQTFNIYNGSGSNGKSKLIDLMAKCLGDYKGSVPTSLVTEKRAMVGGLTPEIAQLQGKRYAVMQEPSKGDQLNDGVMKMLTGEDEIQGRSLYKEPVNYIPQFKLVVCTNNMFQIKSNDDGTWRRIRKVDFVSKFVKQKQIDEANHKFLRDDDIDKKFNEWKEIFISMLVEIAREKKGSVKDCAIVLKASDDYRQEQDYLMEFKNERLIEKTDEIRKTALGSKDMGIRGLYEDFKIWYKQSYGNDVPKQKELKGFLEKHLGKDFLKNYIVKPEDDI